MFLCLEVSITRRQYIKIYILVQLTFNQAKYSCGIF